MPHIHQLLSHFAFDNNLEEKLRRHSARSLIRQKLKLTCFCKAEITSWVLLGTVSNACTLYTKHFRTLLCKKLFQQYCLNNMSNSVKKFVAQILIDGSF